MLPHAAWMMGCSGETDWITFNRFRFASNIFNIFERLRFTAISGQKDCGDEDRCCDKNG